MTRTAFRLAAWDTPLWVSPNRAAGRYNVAGEGPVQYWSLHPLAPWAEYCRTEAVTTVDALAHLRLRLWAGRLPDDATVIDFDRAPAMGLEAADLVADDHAACRALGRRIADDPDGPGAIEVPSAALPGTTNLVLFGPRAAAPYDVEPVGDVDVPVAVAADRARPLHTLLDHVRHRGRPHAGYDAWAAGEALRPPHVPTPMPG